jgi:hypothetical protein
MEDLYKEFQMLDDAGLEYECPFVRFMDHAEKFSCKEVTELIDEDSNLFA